MFFGNEKDTLSVIMTKENKFLLTEEKVLRKLFLEPSEPTIMKILKKRE